MQTVSDFNLLDAFILLVLIGGMALGFRQGFMRQALGLVALYVATVLSAQYHEFVAYWITQQSATVSSNAATVIGFFGILIAAGGFLLWAAWDLSQMLNLRLFAGLEQVGGALLGIVSGGIVVSLILSVILFLAQSPWPGQSEEWRQAFIGAREQSSLYALLKTVLPLMVQSLRPWLPGSLPPIFQLIAPSPG